MDIHDPRDTPDQRRSLPAIGRLLNDPRLSDLIEVYGHDAVRVQARAELARARAGLRGPDSSARAPSADEVASRIAAGVIARLGHPLQRVINATGIFVHTNLGRAPLPRAVAARLPDLLDAYCDVEMDLGTGKRGVRGRRAHELLTALTSAEAALVVNNNAAALMLALATLAQDREVIVSRGELVEIGGSFRIPDIMATSGARLVEVGTTNRTRLADYEQAIGPQTALLLKVHPSNYRICGFTEAVEGRTLAQLGRRRGIPLLVDEGSGLLSDSERPQLRDHPSHRALIEAGCDLVCGSGDKLLGGPQAGILVGDAAWVGRCRRHALYRVLRPNRFVLAALEATLERALRGLPMPLDQLWPEPAAHHARLEGFAAELREQARLEASIIAADAYLGGGSAPEAPVSGEALCLAGGAALLQRLRQGDPAVVGYLREDRVVLDLRTVDAEDHKALLGALVAAGSAGG